jgi:GNAT superfamily N-acetyltransferase
MTSGHTIVLARPQDVAALPGVELAAARLLRGYIIDAVLEETTPVDTFRAAQREGRLWVVLADDVPVGFALVALLASDAPHLQEMDVLPAHGRQGLGTALLNELVRWAAQAGHSAITLTTSRAVPWNMPFYARFGFEELPARDLSPELVAIVKDEAARGMPAAERVVMRYRLRGHARSS